MKYFAVTIIIFVTIIVYWQWPNIMKSGIKQSRLRIGEKVTYNIDIAYNALSRVKGLSDRTKLNEDEGMLFMFPASRVQNFWMKDMNFPLDFVWINDDEIVGVSENINHPAAEQGRTLKVKSPQPVNMVLEISAGQVAKKKIKVGDKVNIMEAKEK